MPFDVKKYPPNWKTEIRLRILARAGNKCEWCGVPDNEYVDRGFWHGVAAYQDMDGNIFNADTGEDIGESYVGDLDKPKITQIRLTVAHLDHDPENHDVKDERLAALCQRCHLHYDKELHKANRKKTLIKKKGQLKLEI